MKPNKPWHRWLRFARGLAAWRRIGRLGPELEAHCGELLRFGRESDREFTALAEGLTGLNSEMEELRAQNAKLDQILQDQDEERALASASGVYRRSVDLVHASMGLSVAEEEQMEEIEQRLLANRERFVKNIMVFRVLVMFVRTESASLSSENQSTFSVVAADIADMVRKMSEVSVTAFGKIESVVAEGVAGRAELLELQADLQQRAQCSVGLLQEEMARIKAAIAPCAESSRCVSGMLADAGTGTTRILTALQYQDIVRQQLEHIVAGFGDIIGLMGESRGGKGRCDLAYLHHAIRLQQNHLRMSRESIEKAGREVTDGLLELLRTGEAIVASLDRMEALTDAAFRDSQLAELFKAETGRLVQIAGQSDRTNRRITRLVEEIEKFARVMSQEITSQEYEVRLVALNAQVAAARLSSAGALNRLAEEISRLSDSTAELTRTMSRELGDTLAQLQRKKGESGEIRLTLGREEGELKAGTAEACAKLERLNDRVRGGTSEVGRKFSVVYDEVGALLPALKFPSMIAQCYGPAESLCERLLAATAEFAHSEDLSDEAVERLDAHKSNYTMHREHQVHADVLGAPGSGAPSAPSAELELFADLTLPADPPAVPAGGSGAEAANNGVELF